MTTTIMRINNAMEQNPFWGVNIRSAGQEIPWILWNSKDHYRDYKSSLIDPILSQINPAHTFTIYFFKTHK